MPLRIMYLSQGLVAFFAGLSGFGASVAASLPDNSQLETIGKWPLTVILGAVCCFCIWINFKQGKNHSQGLILMAEGERLAAEKRTIAHATLTKELAESNAIIAKELAENHAKEIRTLLDEITKRGNQ